MSWPRHDAPLRFAVRLAAALGVLAGTATLAFSQEWRLTAFRRLPSDSPNLLRSEVDFSGGGEILRNEIAARKSVSVSEIRAAFENKTFVTHSGVHGTQVEYTSKDGQAYLWYPGNKIVLAGQWEPKPIFVEYYEQGQLIKRFENSQICFRYGGNTYNPATGHAGDGFECQAFAAYRTQSGERRRGDILRLRGRKEVPFVLTKEPLSFDALRSRVRG